MTTNPTNPKLHPNPSKLARRRIGPTPPPVPERASLASHPLIMAALEKAQAELEAARVRGTKWINAAYRKVAAEAYPGSDRHRAAF